jgi:hypothetical protein
MNIDSKIPSGPIQQKWEKHKFDMKLVNPANRRKYDVIVVGSGLAGASAAATLGGQGYNVKCFCFQDSPRRAHSIAAQKTTKEMATLFTGYSTTPLKVETSEQEKQTFTDLPKSRATLSINAWLKVCPLLAITADF